MGNVGSTIKKKVLEPLFGSENGIVNRQVTAELASIVAKGGDPNDPIGNIFQGGRNMLQNPKETIVGMKQVYSSMRNPLSSIGSKIPVVGGIVQKGVDLALSPMDTGLDALEKVGSAADTVSKIVS